MATHSGTLPELVGRGGWWLPPPQPQELARLKDLVQKVIATPLFLVGLWP